MARCERALEESQSRFIAFRFAACHGWAPNRRSRTEEFLARLARGETLEIPDGVVQNRMASRPLGRAAAACALEGVTGVCHLGTMDQSSEPAFLRLLAKAFGYPEERVVSVPSDRLVMTVVPGALLGVSGGAFRLTESDTLRSVAALPELEKYRAC